MKKTSLIPPRSVVRIRTLWPWAKRQGHYVGQRYRIGYYSKCVLKTGEIWLVDDDGRYDWVVDHPFLNRHFEVEKRSNETDFLGENRKPLGAI